MAKFYHVNCQILVHLKIAFFSCVADGYFLLIKNQFEILKHFFILICTTLIHQNGPHDLRLNLNCMYDVWSIFKQWRQKSWPFGTGLAAEGSGISVSNPCVFSLCLVWLDFEDRSELIWTQALWVAEEIYYSVSPFSEEQ